MENDIEFVNLDLLYDLIVAFVTQLLNVFFPSYSIHIGCFKLAN